MPIINLIVAQAAAAWVAAPNLVAMLFQYGPAYNYIIAGASAVIVLIGAFVGSGLSKKIPRPTLISAFTTIAFAIIGTHLAMLLYAPHTLSSEFAIHAFTFTPVAAAIAGYFATSDRPAA